MRLGRNKRSMVKFMKNKNMRLFRRKDNQLDVFLWEIMGIIQRIIMKIVTIVLLKKDHYNSVVVPGSVWFN
jgi:hypothetical protein